RQCRRDARAAPAAGPSEAGGAAFDDLQNVDVLPFRPAPWDVEEVAMATAERRGPALAPAAKLTIRGVRTRALRVPMRRPLGTSGGTITTAPLVLVDLETEEGVPGRAYLFAYSELGARTLRQFLAGIADMVRGDAVAPVAIAKKLYGRFTLMGREGLPTIAMSGLDVALWDALGRATELPLARLGSRASWRRRSRSARTSSGRTPCRRRSRRGRRTT